VHQGWLHVSALQAAIIRPIGGNNSIKSTTYEMLAHYGIPCGFTKSVIDKKKTVKPVLSHEKKSGNEIFSSIQKEIKTA
jgi:hypothetical protein